MTLPEWLTKSELDNVKDERDWAKRRRGRIQINSGRGWIQKADVRDEEYLWDCKETTKLGYRITVKDWQTLQKWAQKEHRLPGLKIKFIKPDGKIIELRVIPADA